MNSSWPDSPEAGRARQQGRRRFFFVVYLLCLLVMLGAVLSTLKPDQGAKLLFLIPFLLIWLFMFGAALRQLLRRERLHPGSDRAKSVNPEAQKVKTGPVQDKAIWQAYATLGLRPDADWHAVRRTYRELTRQCDPDQYSKEDLASRHRAEEKRQALKAAYTLLRSQPEKGN